MSSPVHSPPTIHLSYLKLQDSIPASGGERLHVWHVLHVLEFEAIAGIVFFWAAASASPQLPSGPWCWMEHSGSISQVEGEMSAGLHVASPGDAIAAQAFASQTADV